jgi:hypothetical protein
MENLESNPGPLRVLEQTRSRHVPYARFWNIAFRTCHLMAISTLVGGHAFGAPAATLKPILYLAIATGAGLIFLEAYPSLSFLFEGWWLLVTAKLILLCLIPFFWNRRFPILLVVITLASIGAHMPARFRHYSVLSRKVIKG